VQHFVEKFNASFDRNVQAMSPEALEALARYHWPGNVRELEAAVENAFAMGHSDIIAREDLPRRILGPAEANGQGPAAGRAALPTLLEAERELLREALKAADGNKSRAAELLGVSRPRLYKMMERHGIRE